MPEWAISSSKDNSEKYNDVAEGWNLIHQDILIIYFYVKTFFEL